MQVLFQTNAFTQETFSCKSVYTEESSRHRSFYTQMMLLRTQAPTCSYTEKGRTMRGGKAEAMCVWYIFRLKHPCGSITAGEAESWSSKKKDEGTRGKKKGRATSRTMWEWVAGGYKCAKKIMEKSECGWSQEQRKDKIRMGADA